MSDRDVLVDEVAKLRAWAIDGMCDLYLEIFPGAADGERDYREQLEMAFESRFPVLARLVADTLHEDAR